MMQSMVDIKAVIMVDMEGTKVVMAAVEGTKVVMAAAEATVEETLVMEEDEEEGVTMAAAGALTMEEGAEGAALTLVRLLRLQNPKPNLDHKP